eukprot:TRINITY_DN7595_c0_g1_i1.p4 TRINITY_DN7595_c0_g1~~TRINITY_DN7595_c0_g1_i1.p4  ORF type:complete len:121 (-),score=12.08 TRINITY_DN7595_c0_g1_i1:91-453(-)
MDMRGGVLQKSSAELRGLLDATMLLRKPIGKTQKPDVRGGDGTQQPMIEIGVNKCYEEAKRIDENLGELRKRIYVSLRWKRKQQSVRPRRVHSSSRWMRFAKGLWVYKERVRRVHWKHTA